MSDLIRKEDAIEAYSDIYWIDDRLNLAFQEELDKIDERIRNIPTVEVADRPQGEWIDCKEPPSTDRNVFIAYGTDDMKSVCIGHYEHDMKLWYEDKNFFAKPMYGAMYWCEIPQFPTRMKGADDDL